MMMVCIFVEIMLMMLMTMACFMMDCTIFAGFFLFVRMLHKFIGMVPMSCHTHSVYGWVKVLLLIFANHAGPH